MQLILRGGVLGGHVGQVPKDLPAVDGQGGQQEQFLPSGTQQTGVVLDGELAKEGQPLDPGDLPEEELVRQATEKRKELGLSDLVPAERGRWWQLKRLEKHLARPPTP